MSRSTTCTFTCPCGKVFNSPIYEYVNTAHDPQLQYTVLAGLLNVSRCPVCGRRAVLSRPFIYSDPSHDLLAYVHPSPDVPEAARQLIHSKLQAVFARSETGAVSTEMEPHLHIVFGLAQLYQLINATLSQDERLGRLALSTHSQREAERGQLLDIARKFASEMQCQVDVEEQPHAYTVWLYGSRRQIGAIMRELTPQG